MNWLHYLAEANIYLSVFYLVYCLFLIKETHYAFNRVYLLFSCVVSFILPVIQLGFLKAAVLQQQPLTLTVVRNTVHSYVPALEVAPVHNYFNVQNMLLGVYLLGVIILIVFFGIKLNRLFKLTRTRSTEVGEQFKLIQINDSNTAFSFFNYLFIGAKALDADVIIRHELVHIRQKHSVDIILLEILKIINWFNPLVYLLQNSLKTVHEYIADEQTALYQNDNLTYSAFLINNAYGIGGPSITHSFFNYNLLKKRIIMLNQKRSGSLARLKYLLIIPVCAGLLCVSTLGFSKTYGWVDLAPAHKLTLNGKSPSFNGGDTAKNKLKKASKGTYKNSGITPKGYKYKETGYLINNKADFRVIIIEKNGEEKAWFKNTATSTEIAMLKDDYGYIFPSMDIFTKLPPPPPVPPGLQPPNDDQAPLRPERPIRPLKMKKLPPPVVIPMDTAVHAKLAAPGPPPKPPMEPHLPLTNAFRALDKYMGKYTRYPAVALENKVIGSVVAQFELNADHKITNVTLIKGIGSRCDEEAIRVLNNFNDPIDTKPGTYKLAVTFTIDGLDAPKPASEELSNDPLFIGEVVIASYYKYF